MRRSFLILLAGLWVAVPSAAQPQPTYLPVGLFFASIEEGARIFTPVRFLPFGHPEALTHEFPTVLQLHRGEFDLLVHLGRLVGYGLAPTLQRYPTEPDSTWPYVGFRSPPAETFGPAPQIHRPRTESPLPGLRAIAVLDRIPIAFLVDTRGLSLEQRGMAHGTTMGLDLTRQQFLDGLLRGAQFAPAHGPAFVLFDPGASGG